MIYSIIFFGFVYSCIFSSYKKKKYFSISSCIPNFALAENKHVVYQFRSNSTDVFDVNHTDVSHTHTLSSFTKRRAARLANRNIPYNRFRPEEASRRLYLADRPAVFTLEICMDGMRWFKNKAHLAGGERYDCPWPVESPFGWTQTRARVPSRSKSRSIRFKNEWKGRGRGKKKNGNETNGPSWPRVIYSARFCRKHDRPDLWHRAECSNSDVSEGRNVIYV